MNTSTIPQKYLLSEEELDRARFDYAPGQLKRLEDGTVACLADLMFTRSVQLGCTIWGPEFRYCYDPREEADVAFAKLKAWDDKPEGWIAKRPQDE